MGVSEAKPKLLEWYRQNKRELPWRENRDPYRIWISETMLQQTTTTAVIPFFERFVTRFPTLNALAAAKTEAVVEAWAGLGYYSRARNLHKSAQALQAGGGFPRTFEELITYPGFGPYTARSVASLAFDQEVGVVDGNVIRVLSRFEGQAWDFWKPKVRDEIQVHADNWVKGVPSYEMNQALMELGRTICTPKTPACLLCPIAKQGCVAFKRGLTAQLPKPKPRRERELWLWNPSVQIKNGRILIEKNTHAPFLRGQWLLPGTAERLDRKPKSYHYKHSITHHDIFVTVKDSLPKMADAVTKWVHLKEIRQHVPLPSYKKLSHRRWLILLAATLATVTACKSKSKLAEPPPEAAITAVQVGESFLVEDGESSQATYSPKGDRLLFVSAKRTGHNQPQVYEKDLSSGLERRITFQSGSTFHPRFSPEAGFIIYSSSTDELKENSPLLAAAAAKPSRLPPLFNEPVELYVHGLSGLDIRRFTQRAGFDGEARFSLDGKSLVWTRTVKDRLQTVIAPFAAGGVPRVLQGLGDNPASFTSSPNGKMAAWIDWDQTFGLSRLKFRRGREIVEVAADLIVTKADPEFSPDSKWLLWSQKDPQTNLFEIWGYALENECLHHFTFSSAADRRGPVVSPDMKWLTFTWVKGAGLELHACPLCN